MKFLIKVFVVDKDKLPDLAWLSSNEYFIPVYFDDILEKVRSDERFTIQEREYLDNLALMFKEHYHLDYHEKFLKLKRDFSCFDPDSETLWLKPLTEEALEEKRSSFLRGIEDFLTVCNYTEISSENLATLLKAPYPGLKLSIDMEKLDFFRIYYRGAIKEERIIKKFLFLEERYSSQTFKRVFIIARYKKEQENNLKKEFIAKLFRDVSVENLKVVIPETRLTLPWLDKIIVAAGFGTAIIVFLIKLVVAAMMSIVMLAALLFTFAKTAIRNIFSIFNARNKYLKIYSENLYKHSLAGNMAAANLLVEQAETQEVKEAFLAYFMLYLYRRKNLSDEELAQKVEKWIKEKFSLDFKFEVDDALNKLAEKKLLKKFPATGTDKSYFKVYDLPSALRRLDELWDNHHLNNNEGNPGQDRLAASPYRPIRKCAAPSFQRFAKNSRSRSTQRLKNQKIQQKRKFIR